MSLTQFFAENWDTILLGLISAGLLALCRYFYRQVKTYKTFLKAEEEKKTELMIEHHLEPLIQDVEELRDYIISLDNEETKHINLILASYRYRLIALCKGYIKQGYITFEQYEQLNEFYLIYSGLGGNGQAKEYYEKAKQLPQEPKA